MADKVTGILNLLKSLVKQTPTTTSTDLTIPAKAELEKLPEEDLDKIYNQLTAVDRRELMRGGLAAIVNAAMDVGALGQLTKIAKKVEKATDMPDVDLPNPIYLDSFKDTGIYKSVKKMYADDSGMDIDELTPSQESGLEAMAIEAIDPHSQTFPDWEVLQHATDSEIMVMLSELMSKYNMPRDKAESILDEMGADISGRARAREVETTEKLEQLAVKSFFNLPSVKSVVDELNDLNMSEMGEMGEYTAQEIFEGNEYFGEMIDHLEGALDFDDLDDYPARVIEEMRDTYKMTDEQIKSMIEKAMED